MNQREIGEEFILIVGHENGRNRWAQNMGQL